MTSISFDPLLLNLTPTCQDQSLQNFHMLSQMPMLLTGNKSKHMLHSYLVLSPKTMTVALIHVFALLDPTLSQCHAPTAKNHVLTVTPSHVRSLCTCPLSLAFKQLRHGYEDAVLSTRISIQPPNYQRCLRFRTLSRAS